MKSRVVPLRIPESLDELAALSAQEEHTDKATALRQWLHRGAAQYVLKLVAEGRISIGRAAELLDVTVYDLHYLAETQGIELGATDEQRRQSRAVVAKLVQGNA
ncbi:MAG: hypothetical protein HY683_08515 [Chloroflexi bacterium]|nr:hypothetical protein [Chloroflexota bacterium]